jgi:hypothetical protein
VAGPKRLMDATWQLAWALLVCAVLFAFLRQLALGGRTAAGGLSEGSSILWINVALARVCALLFVIGLVVRVKHWLFERSAESARKRRLEAAHTLVGAPERFGPRSIGARLQRRGQRVPQGRRRKH